MNEVTRLREFTGRLRMKRYRIGLTIQIIGLIYEVLVIIISNYSVGIFMPSNVPTTIIPGVILIGVGLFFKVINPIIEVTG